MAISRLQASLAAVTNEFTVAAAHINFDLTLIRCEAPKEHRALGDNLSRKRKVEAESGTIHATARRLGAPFDGICLPTPKLLQAYGTRVSEISEAAKDKAGLDTTDSGPFSAHSGIDGASIWAAATSSTTAIHVQLLACMLARIWSREEATSAWVELVKERKRTIASLFEEGTSIPYPLMNAVGQLDMPRTQLADWDASARSWLRTADTIKKEEQQTLISILDKLKIPGNEISQLFPSVVAAWIAALTSMEMLLDGIPQAANSGPTLLALGSWFLYPDIIVLGTDSTHHSF